MIENSSHSSGITVLFVSNRVGGDKFVGSPCSSVSSISHSSHRLERRASAPAILTYVQLARMTPDMRLCTHSIKQARTSLSRTAYSDDVEMVSPAWQ